MWVRNVIMIENMYLVPQLVTTLLTPQLLQIISEPITGIFAQGTLFMFSITSTVRPLILYVRLLHPLIPSAYFI